MSNFFNAIGVADMEKIHSAMIGWILSDKCKAFNTKEKSKILCSIFKISPYTFKEINVNVEVFDIDILITTKRDVNVEECWVIENKIKSNQHSNQLDKYVDIINGKAKTKRSKPITMNYKHIIDSNQHYCFLTLIDEAPIGKYWKKWVNAKYSDLSGILCGYKSVTTGDDGVIFRQYVECISDLSYSLKDFCCNPQYYPHVFTDGSKKKTDKNYSAIKCDKGKYALYIAECGLETIFQKAFLKQYVKKNVPSISSNIDVKDTRGVAMFDYTYKEIGDFLLQIQFQGKTFKVVVLHKDYNDVNSYKYTKLIYGNLDIHKGGSDKVYRIFISLKNGDWKYAPADNLGKKNAKPRIALDNNKIAANWIYEPADFVKGFQEAQKLAEDIAKRLTSIP